MSTSNCFIFLSIAKIGIFFKLELKLEYVSVRKNSSKLDFFTHLRTYFRPSLI